MKKKLIAMALTAMLAFSAQALELDVSETSADETAETAYVQADSTGVPNYSAKYGELVYYNDFETSYQTASYVMDGLTITIGGDTQENFEIADKPNSTGKALKVTATGSEPGFNLSVSGYSVEGTKLTAIVEYYLPSSLTKANVWWRVNGDGGQSNWELANDKRDTWYENSWTTNTLTELKTFEFRNSTASGESWYIDNVRIYANAPLADNEMLIIDGDKCERIDLNTVEDPYCFPSAEENSGEWFIYVMDDGSAVWQGTAVSPSDAGGHTVTVVRSTSPKFDEKYGQLVMFHGFEGDSHSNIDFVDRTLFFVDDITWSAGNGLGFNNYKVVDAYGSDGHALEMTLKDGAGWNISGFQYNFNTYSDTLRAGKISVVMDVYNRNEGTSLEKLTFGMTDNGDIGTYEDDAQWKNKTFAKNTWTRKAVTEQWTIAENTDEATKEQYKYKIGFDMTQNHTQTKANKLKSLQYRFTGKDKTSVSVDNICMYYWPADAVMLKADGLLSWVYADEDGMYTFECNDGYFFTDGNDIYENGDKAAIEKLAGKTFELREPYDEESNVKFTYSLYADGTSENTGFGIKATFSKKMTASAEELGFVVSKAESGMFSDHKPEEGKDVIVAAYKKGSSDNKYSLQDDGTSTATGFVTGFDITSSEQLETNFDFRVYSKLKKADGGTLYVYGMNSNLGLTTSMYNAAATIKDFVAHPDEYTHITQEMKDAATASYEAANYDGGNYIDDIVNLF